MHVHPNRSFRLPLVALLLAAFCVLAIAQEDRVAIHQAEGDFLRLFRGSESGLSEGATGILYNVHEQQIGTLEVISVEDVVSIARVSLDRPRAEMDDIERVEISVADEQTGEARTYKDVNFRIEQRNQFFVLEKGADDGIRKGWKGELYDDEGELVCFFRVITRTRNPAMAVGFSLNIGKEFDDAGYGAFKSYFEQILTTTGFVNLSPGNLIMIAVGLLFIYLAVAKDYEPLLLVPIGFGILIGNIPFPVQLFNNLSVYMIDPLTQQYIFNTTTNSVLGVIYSLVTSGFLPPMIFLGIGAMTDFTALLSNPKTVLLGAAAQIGIFATFIGAFLLGFTPAQSASIGIIGGADGPTAIFLTSQLAPTLIGPIAIAAYSYMGLIPIIQPPLMKLLTTKKERRIKMKPGRKVTKTEKIVFPIAGFLVTTMIAPGAIPLLGMLFFGNLLKESGVTNRLAKTASTSLIDIATILLGVGVGASTTAQVFLNEQSIFIFILGSIAFAVATCSGLLFAKGMNLFLGKDNKINPLIGSAGVSAVPDAARVSEMIGRESDPNNHLLMHAMGPNVAGVIGSAIAAGILMGIF